MKGYISSGIHLLKWNLCSFFGDLTWNFIFLYSLKIAEGFV